MKILVSKPDALGDQILAVGFVQALRRQWPEARIVWHVRAGMETIASVVEGAAVFRLNDRAAPAAEAARLWAETAASIVIVPCAINPFGNWEPSLVDHYAWWGEFLAGTAWDLAIAPVVNRTGLSDFTVTASHATRRVAFKTNVACQPMIEAVFSNLPGKKPDFTDEIASSLDGSEWSHYTAMLAAIAPSETLRAPLLHVAPHATAAADNLLGTTTERLVLLAPGVGENTQRAWPIAEFIRAAAELRARDYDVRWIQGPHDAAYFAQMPETEIRARLAIEANRFDVLAAVFRGAALVLCNDTAYVHLAASLDTPAVAIFGAGQKDRFVPRFGRVRVVQGDPVCRGCQWQCAFARHVCIQDVPYATVWSNVEAQLAHGETAHERCALPLPLAPAMGQPSAEIERVRDWYQQELFRLRWDGWARLQIINDVLVRLQDRDQRLAELARERDTLSAALREKETAPAAPAVQPSLPKLSVIIPMGRPERADGTLQSLIRQTLRPPSWEVVVVGVGASTLLPRYPELPVVPVDLQANVLPPRTRAEGVARATGEWYVFVDDDIQLAPDFFEMLARAFAVTPTTSSAAHLQVGAIGVRLPGGRGTYFERLTDISNFWSQQSSIRAVPHTIWFLYSATIVVRAEAYRRSGGFNVNLPNGEDVDLTQRIKAAGYILAYEPSLVAYHFHGRDSMFRMWRYFWRNGNAAQYFFAQLGGVCCYSVRTVLKRTWGDLQMNRRFQKTQGVRLGSRVPWILLNYLIVESSLEWHYQEYLWQSKQFKELPARTASDRRTAQAFTALQQGRKLQAVGHYALAMLQNVADPVRR